MEGGRGITWANFEETAQRSDMAIYGEEPAIDSLSLVVCKECGRVVKSQALVNHKEQYHSARLDIPVPQPLPPYTPPVRPAHTIGLPSNAINTTPSVSGVRGDNVMGFTASDLPTSSFSGTAGRTQKEFDSSRHCGVWIDEEKRQCTHSLNCKIHSLEARQNVRGRSKPLEILLKERKLKKKNKLKRGDSQSSMFQTSSKSPLPTSQQFELASSPSGPSSDGPGTVGSWITSPTERDISEEQIPVDMESFPRPLAVCSFGMRSTLTGGGVLLGRAADSLRATLATLSGRTGDYNHSTTHRKHSFSWLSQQRGRRKYYNHRHSRRRSSPSQPLHKLPVPPPPNPPPQTPSHPLTSPLTASTVLTNLSSLITLPTSSHPPTSPSTPDEGPVDPVQRSNTVTTPVVAPRLDPFSSDGILPDAGSGFLNHTPDHLVPQTVPSTESMETDKVQSSKGPGKKSKSRRNKRKRHKQSKDTSASGDDLLTPHSERPTVNGVLSQHDSEVRGRPEHSLPARSEVRGQFEQPLPMQPGVRVKDEPLSDHEETAAGHQIPTTKTPSVGLNGIVAPNAGSSAHHSFNSALNSPQSFVINPSHQLSSGYPLMTTLSPHMRSMLPLAGMAQNTNLFQPQQHFQLGSNPVTSPAGTTPPLRPNLQLLPDALQRQLMQQNAALLLASNPALLQQQQQQGGGFINLANMALSNQQQKSSSLTSTPPGIPQLHHMGGSTGGVGSQPILSNFQLPNRTSQTSSKVRAPISHIPSTAQRSLPQLSSLGQAQSIPTSNQSLYHRGMQATPTGATQRFPSQVT